MTEKGRKIYEVKREEGVEERGRENEWLLPGAPSTAAPQCSDM